MTKRSSFPGFRFPPFLYFSNEEAWSRVLPSAAGESRTRVPFVFHAGSRLGLSLLAVLALSSFCLALACWNARQDSPGRAGPLGIDLRAGVASPKVNTMIGVPEAQTAVVLPRIEFEPKRLVSAPDLPPTPGMFLPEPPPPVPPFIVEVIPVSSPVVAVPELLPPPLEVIAVPVPGVVELPPPPPPLQPVAPPVLIETDPPLIYAFVPHRGEPPMLRNWKMLSLAAVAALALNVSPVLAQADGPQPEDKFAALQKQLELINANLKKAFEGVGLDMKGIRDDVKKVRDENDDAKVKLELGLNKIDMLDKQVQGMARELESLKLRFPSDKVSLYPATDKAALDEIRLKLSEVEKALRKLEPSGRVALSSPTVGRMVLVNTHIEEMLFNINGRSIRVAPGLTQTIENIPAGVVSYEVISPTHGLRASRTPVLAANETITLTVR